MDNQYYKEETSAYQLQYSSPDSDYCNFPPRRSQKPPHDLNGYYPPPLDPADVQCWHAWVEGGEPYYMDIDYMERKPDRQKVERPDRDGKIINRGYRN